MMMMMTTMMSFYRKSLHSFLSFADTQHHLSSPNYSKSNSHFEQQHAFLAAAGLGGLLINSHNNNDDNVVQINNKSPNILESSFVLNLPDLSAYSSSSSSSSTARKDSGGSGFLDEFGSPVVDGLMSCTESLGFESSDERLANDNHHEVMIMTKDAGHDHDHDDGGCSLTGWRRRRRRVVERKFPPPLTSLNQHGHPNFYLRPVRKDGRLELTEIRIERPEILRACREDGRLRLQLIKENDDDHNDQIIEEEEEEEQEDEKVAEGLVKEGKMEFRRCVDMVNHQRRREHHRGHHHQHLDLWRQHCVTTS